MSKNHPTIKTYTIGFVLSVVLTLIAFAVVISGGLPYWVIVFIILALAVVQLFVQLYFFLHIKDEGKPKLKMHSHSYSKFITTSKSLFKGVKSKLNQ